MVPALVTDSLLKENARAAWAAVLATEDAADAARAAWIVARDALDAEATDSLHSYPCLSLPFPPQTDGISPR